ncbi:GPCR, family 2-like protein [Rhypophila sp. PSN 637]
MHSQGDPSFTVDQLRTILISIRVASGLSLVGVIVIITTFCLSPRFRNPMHRLIFINAFYNIFDSAATFASRAGPEAGEASALCQTQAFLNQMFPLADVLWSLVMAIDVYLIVFGRYDAQSLKRLEWKYVVAVTVLTFIPAFSFLFLRRGNGDRIYGDAVVWCTIPPSDPIIRIASYYIPIWVSIFITLGLYFRIGLEIIKRRQALLSISNHSVQLDNTLLPLTQLPIPQFPKPSQETKAVESDIEPPSSSSESTPTKSSHVIQSIKPFSPPSSPSPIMVCRTPNSDSESASQVRIHLQRSSSLSFRQYIIMPLLFALTLFSVWVPSTVNRIVPTIDSSFRSYPLLVLAGTSCSMRGFWNAIVFVLVGRGSRKSRTHMRRPAEPRDTGRNQSPV